MRFVLVGRGWLGVEGERPPTMGGCAALLPRQAVFGGLSPVADAGGWGDVSFTI